MSRPVHQAIRILIWQLSWVALSMLITWLLVNQRWALSIMIGASVGLLATLYTSVVMIKHVLNVTRPATLFTVLSTWLIKAMLVVGLLLIAFRLPHVLPLAVIVGLTGSLVAYWCAVYFSFNK